MRSVEPINDREAARYRESVVYMAMLAEAADDRVAQLEAELRATRDGGARIRIAKRLKSIRRADFGGRIRKIVPQPRASA